VESSGRNMYYAAEIKQSLLSVFDNN